MVITKSPEEYEYKGNWFSETCAMQRRAGRSPKGEQHSLP